MIEQSMEYKIKNQVKKQIKKRIKQALLMLLNTFKVPILIFTVVLLLVCYITDILYIGVNNEEKSNMKNEMKYYTTEEYTEEETKSFFESVGEFISGLFAEIISDSDWPVEGKSEKDITSYYGYREAPTAGASTFHSRN